MNQNFYLLLPELLVTGLAFLVLTADFVLPLRRKNTVLASLSAIGLIGILIFSVFYLWQKNSGLYCTNAATLSNCIYQVDNYALFFKTFFLILGATIVIISMDFTKRYIEHPGEYYGLLLFSILAMMLMTASGELLTAYISLELLSFSLYILVSLLQKNSRSTEAGTKYILLGAFSTALLLYGISFVYISVGETRFDAISAFLSSNGVGDPTLLIGIALVIAGLGFKVAAFPFHMWAPDIYQGAPLPITAYLSVGAKAGAMALFLRLFAEAFGPAVESWGVLVAFLSALTMTVGNLAALVQSNIKRLLAYSSIGQAGYLLMGLAALSSLASTGMILHLVGYAATNLALFLGIIAVYNVTANEKIDGLDGLSQRQPFVALVISVALFSLAGLPFFAGFTTKFYLFVAVAEEGLLWLAGLAVINSVVSLYYYLVIIRHMYIHSPSKENENVFPIPILTRVTLCALLGAILVIGLYPAVLLDAVNAASASLFTG